MPGLERFRDAQNSPYDGFESALSEVRRGGKRGHWIWYVFPQLAGLGMSSTSKTFALPDQKDAMEYLRDPELGSRYLTITRAVAEQLRAGIPLHALMGSDIDAKKLVSSLTLFGHAARKLRDQEGGSVYGAVATLADEVLAKAASQGYPPCAYTLQRLRHHDEHDRDEHAEA